MKMIKVIPYFTTEYYRIASWLKGKVCCQQWKDAFSLLHNYQVIVSEGSNTLPDSYVPKLIKER